MAKSASRFSQSGSRGGGNDNLDGTSWMAQRRKKTQEQEEEMRRSREESARREKEEKRERRKTQLDALKAAVKEIEASSVSSLQAAAAAPNQRGPRAPPSPVRILSRPSVSETPQLPESVREEDESVKSVSTASSNHMQHRGGGRGRGRGRHGDSSPSRRSVPPKSDNPRKTSGRGSLFDGNREKAGSTGRFSSTTGHGRHSGRAGRGRGGRSGAARVNVGVGETTVVRTSSGNVEYRINLENEDSEKTKGELLPNGTVRLSRNKAGKAKPSGKKGGRGHSKQKAHTSLKTKLEIGPEKK